MSWATPPEEAWTLRGRWVFPVAGPPLANGCLTIQRDRITHVGTDRRPDLDLGNVALLPGFVNAHTHLDLTGLQGRCPPTPSLPDWLCQVRAARHAADPEQVQQAIAAGIADCLRFGTTLVGDIASQGTSGPLLREAPLRSVVFYELLGLPVERAEHARRLTLDWLASFRATDCCRPGLSPHAPYSVRRELFAWVAALAREHGLPVAIHLAESAAELELLHQRRGPFVSFLQALNVWDPAGLVTGPAEVADLFREVPHTGFVHGNYLPADFSPRPEQGVIYCPRTHAAFAHEPHPFRDLLKRGVRVALGTDSLASNPDLDILAEARFLHDRHPDLPGDVLLRLLTLSGAEVLGWQDETGSLTPGKSADVVVLPLPDADEPDPHRLLWSELPVQAVSFRGKWVRMESSR